MIAFLQAQTKPVAQTGAQIQYPVLDSEFGNIFLLGSPFGIFELAKKDADRKFTDDAQIVCADGSASKLYVKASLQTQTSGRSCVLRFVLHPSTLSC